MKGKFLLLGCLLMLAAALTIGSAPAQATIFNFDDMYYFSSTGSSAFNARYGTANSGQRSGVGVYQETDTIDPVVITKLGTASGGSIPGEFEVNTTLNASRALQLTSGWAQSLNNGQQVANVYNTIVNPYFRYVTGVTGGVIGTGTPTTFTFNSFDLRGTGTVTFEATDASNNVLFTDTVTLSSGFTTVTETDWTNVYQIYFLSGLSGSSAQMYMDNIHINEASAVPVPGALLLLGAGLVRLGTYARRKRALTLA